MQLLESEENIEKEKLLVETRLAEKQRKEEMYIEIADKKVRELKEKAKSFIDPNNLEFEIEKMLSERHDYNFSIGNNGSLYKNSSKVSRAQAFDTRFLEEEVDVSAQNNIV